MRVIKQIMLTFTTNWEVARGEWWVVCESVDGFKV